LASVARQLASISDEKLQELRDRADVVAVVQRRVALKKSGRDWKGLCPFHGEKTPSFYVVPDKHLWHCFGCGASGDAIKFLMQLESRSFREAVEQLAGEFGVDLAPPDPEEARRSSRRAQLAEVNEKAAGFYERVLWEHPFGEVAREHLRKRGITEETARAWRLGYAPDKWDSLCKSKALHGVEAGMIEEAGLGVPRKKGQGLYDRFRGRLMIPIRESGRIVGFGGRLLEGESEAKYLNSPDTPLYTKGLVLFGLERARQIIRDRRDVLVVEGYFDVIGLHQGGVANVVATCGTSLTEKHVELLKKSGVEDLIFLFDGDAAGVRAAQRASEIAAGAKMSARVLVPPNGEDPDELLARVAQVGFDEMVAKQAIPSLEFLLDRALDKVGQKPSIEKRVSIVHEVKALLLAPKDPLTRDTYLRKAAERLQIDAEAIRRTLNGQSAPPPPARQPSAKEGKVVSSAAARMEIVLVAAIVRHPALRKTFSQSGVSSDFVLGPLRDAAETISREGDVEAAIREIESDALRARIVDAIAESERAEDQLDAKGLSNLIKKHAQTVALERNDRPAPPVE
jgi:DNA primase